MSSVDDILFGPIRTTPDYYLFSIDGVALFGVSETLTGQHGVVAILIEDRTGTIPVRGVKFFESHDKAIEWHEAFCDDRTNDFAYLIYNGEFTKDTLETIISQAWTTSMGATIP